MSSTEKSLVAETQRFLDLHGIDAHKGIVVAFSGGSDSLGMLCILSSMFPAGCLHPVYVNHNLRTERELADEVLLNQENCIRLGCPLEVVVFETGLVAETARVRGMGVEEAARFLRYEALQQIQQRLGYAYIATAHTSDDQLETLLMRLLQASDISTMRGIAPVNGQVVRPVLHSDRQKLQQLLVEKGMHWAEDSTNGEDQYLRNKIRHTLVGPVLQVFAHAREGACDFASKADMALDFMRQSLQSQFPPIELELDGSISVGITACMQLHPYVRMQLAYRMWDLLHANERLSHEMASRVGALFVAQPGTLVQACGTTAVREQDRLVWRKDAVPACQFVRKVEYPLTLLPGGNWLSVGKVVPGSDMASSQLIAVADASLQVPLVVRTWQDGDAICLEDGTVSVSKMIGGWKLPQGRRNEVLVLEDRSGIVAVLGRFLGGRDRLAKRYKVFGALAPNDISHYSVLQRNECSE